jgi:hypothetical protein
MYPDVLISGFHERHHESDPGARNHRSDMYDDDVIGNNNHNKLKQHNVIEAKLDRGTVGATG